MIAAFGGIFALLVFVHFVSDWLLQSHDEAMRKTSDALVRAEHCFIYSLSFVPFMNWFELTISEALISFALLFFSHFVEDTYYPVMLWAKYVRRPPDFKMIVFNDEMTNGKQLSDRDAFIRWASEPLGKIIAIVVDQLVHIAFLFPIAYFAVT